MNWEATSAIADIIGIVLIVASLIYISLQTKQSKEQAAAASEIAFIDGIDRMFGSWATDDHTATVVREGLRNFNELSKSDQALFAGIVGALVNRLNLADNLAARNLLPGEIADEVRKVAMSVLTTDGGLQYWEHDSKITPGGREILEEAKKLKGHAPSISDLIPWWQAD